MEYGPCRKELARIKELENDYAQLLEQHGYQTEEVRKLEQWQKEAVPHLRKLEDWVDEQSPIYNLIKQAEEK
jgi:hypothetical protein